MIGKDAASEKLRGGEPEEIWVRTVRRCADALICWPILLAGRPNPGRREKGGRWSGFINCFEGEQCYEIIAV